MLCVMLSFVYTITGKVCTVRLQIHECAADEHPTWRTAATVIVYVSAKANITFITSEELLGKCFRACIGDTFVSLCVYTCESEAFTLPSCWCDSFPGRRDAGLCRAILWYLMVSARRPVTLPALFFATPFVLPRKGESPLLPLSPTFISSLPIKHDLSAHFAWRHLIAWRWGTSPNRLSAGSYGDYLNCVWTAELPSLLWPPTSWGSPLCKFTNKLQVTTFSSHKCSYWGIVKYFLKKVSLFHSS